MRDFAGSSYIYYKYDPVKTSILLLNVIRMPYFSSLAKWERKAFFGCGVAALVVAMVAGLCDDFHFSCISKTRQET